MADVNRLIAQQLGNKRWKHCDSQLERLRCLRKEDFNRIDASDGDQGGEAEPETPIFACKFAQKLGNEHLLALANEDGKLAVCNTSHKHLQTEPRLSKRAHYNAIFDLAWMFGQMKIVTVSGDHSARLIDVSDDRLECMQMFNGHTRSVKTVAFRKRDEWMFATGGRDGSILLWDVRTDTHTDCIAVPIDKIDNSHCTLPGHNLKGTPKRRAVHANCCVSGANSVTGLVFRDEQTLISCGAGDGNIKLWDLRKTYSLSKREPMPKQCLPYPGLTSRNGYCNLLVDEAGVRLYASCLDNSIYCYNIAGLESLAPVATYKGHQNRTYYVKSSLSADGRYLLSGSSDHYAYVWNTEALADVEPLIKLKGHSAEVTCVDWSSRPGIWTIVTCSDDMTHKIWRVGTEVVPDNWEVEGSGEAVAFNNTSNVNKRVLPDHSENHSFKRLRLQEPRARKRLLPDAHTAIEQCLKRLKPMSLEFRESIKSDCRGSVNSQLQESINSRLRESMNSDFRVGSQLQESISSQLRQSMSSAFERDYLLSPRGGFGLLSSHPCCSNEDASSLITNLPNFNIDGEAPHLNLSPQKKPDKDWLTKMTIEKKILKRMQDLTTSDDEPSTPKQPRLDATPRSCRTPRSRRGTPKRAESPKSPLLRFFKVRNNGSSPTCTPSKNVPLSCNTPPTVP